MKDTKCSDFPREDKTTTFLFFVFSDGQGGGRRKKEGESSQRNEKEGKIFFWMVEDVFLLFLMCVRIVKIVDS